MGPSTSHRKIRSVLQKLSNARTLVVGDLMMDEFVWGNAGRISPEAPVPVVNVERQSAHPGGAANTALNVKTLGAKTALCGVVGNDANGKRLLALLKEHGLDSSFILKDNTRRTTCKMRIVAQGQQVMRADHEDTHEISPRIAARLLAAIAKNVRKFDCIAVSDYDKGLLGPRLTGGLITLAKENKIPILVDAKPKNMALFKGVTLLKPNRKEASQISGVEIVDDLTLRQAASVIMRDFRPEAALVTLGAQGMALIRPDGSEFRVAACTSQVYDVTGAGDTTLATLAASVGCGMKLEEAVTLANFAAGVVVRKREPKTVRPDELEAIILGKYIA